MTETLYGAWRIDVGFREIAPHLFLRVVIAGSENADGPHILADNDQPELVVQGEEWTIDMEFLEESVNGGQWTIMPFKRQNRFDLGDGLVVDLDSFTAPDIKIPPPLQLICTSMDPEVNPIPTDNPYDFTIHQGVAH